MKDKKLVLIDGFSIIHRAFYGVPDLTNSKGIHTNAIFGFLNIMFKVIDQEQPDYLTVAFDVHHPTFRHEMYPEYKGTRKPMPDELRQQIPHLKELLSKMKTCTVEKAGYEADDLLGTLAIRGQQEGMKVCVVSGDRDLLQLATDRIMIRIPKTKRTGTEVEDYLWKDVVEKYGIEPPRIVDLKGLMGDVSDNIPGVPGIGEKTATKILTEFGTLEEAYNRIEEVKPNRARENLREYIEQARLSYTLATIKTDCDISYEFSDAEFGNIFTQEAYNKLLELECRSILARFPKDAKETKVISFDEEKLIRDLNGKELPKFLKRLAKYDQEKNSDSESVTVAFRIYGKDRKQRNDALPAAPRHTSWSEEEELPGSNSVSALPAAPRLASWSEGVNFDSSGQMVLPGLLGNQSQEVVTEAHLPEVVGIALAYAVATPVPAQEGGDQPSSQSEKAAKNQEEQEFVWKESIYCLFESETQMEQGFARIRECMVNLKHTTFVTSQLKEQMYYMRKLLSDSYGQVRIGDCEIAAYLCDPMKQDYPVQMLASQLLGLELESYADLFGKKPCYQILQEQKFGAFVCQEVAAISLCYQKILQTMKEYEMLPLYEEIELPLTDTLYEMEERGVRVDRRALADYGESLNGRILSLEREIYELADESFNINSPKQLGVILFERMCLPGGKKTKTGYSTSADVLEKLRVSLKGENETGARLIDDVLEYRTLTKLKSTYADGLAAFIESDERIHGKLNQTVTATGRLSSTEPNLQNIPIRMELGRKIREVFIPREGWCFLDADYSQIELRILAQMSGDEKLIKAYQTDEDIHKITASEVFHVPLEEVTEQLRRNAKAVNFGIVYGISSFGLGQGLNISKKEAEGFIKRYFETYPKVSEFLKELVSSAKKQGYAKSLYQRIRPIPELKSSNFMQRSFGERAAMNSPIQGTAADIMKLAMIRVDQRLKKEGLESAILLQIHDELLVETKPEEVLQVKQILKEEMEQVVDFAVPLVADVKQGKNWLEAH